MDKSWMTMGKTPDGRLSHPYIEGVNTFINFAKVVVDSSGKFTLIMSNSSNSYNNIFIIHIHFILQDQFELEGDSNLVTKTLNTKCGRLLSSNSYKLHQAYKKLKQSHGADYARSHPQMNATLKQWTELIDGRWTNEDWLVNYLCVY